MNDSKDLGFDSVPGIVKRLRDHAADNEGSGAYYGTDPRLYKEAADLLELLFGKMQSTDTLEQEISDPMIRVPRRFRYIPNNGGAWCYGVVQPVSERIGSPWRVVCLDSGGFGGFDSDPWETLGHIIGEVQAFEWIDREDQFHGYP